jgi:hypothetical protein
MEKALRVSVIGDVSGHRDALWAELVRLGMNPGTHQLAEGMGVVLVGDLVDRGPDSLGVLDLVERLWETNPDRVGVLVGNHEANWLGRTQVFIADTTPEVVVRLGALARRGLFSVAAVVGAGDDDVLITHAGLSVGAWVQLGRPLGARAAAAALAEAWETGGGVVFNEGRMLGEVNPVAPGVLWTECGFELYGPWINAGAVPFSQVHGHSSVVGWERRRTWGPAWVMELVELDEERRHTRVELDGGFLLGVDPGLGVVGHNHWRAGELVGELWIPSPVVVALR